MSFSAAWLTLREPFDQRARNPEVLDAAIGALAGRPSVNIVDLACGTGSTRRAIGPRLPERQNWRMYDNNISLLARAGGGAGVTTIPLDLAHDLEAALDGPVDLVTTSALLDLVSAEWLERLAIEVAARRIPVYAALSYDGRVTFDPADPLDEAVTAAVNAHQRGEKGFGPALGPQAASAAIEWFERVGYTVVYGEADWVFGPQDREIQNEILSGWATAAREIGRPSLSDLTDWLTRRRGAVSSGQSTIRVGHVDIFARPIGSR